MIYRLHPAAEQDLREAAAHYSDRAGKLLAQAFFTEFDRSVGILLRHPGLGALWRHSNRRLLMSRFPYSVIYTVASDEIRIVAVAHHSRRPGYWRGRKWPE